MTAHTHTHTPPSVEGTAGLSHRAFHHTVTHICCPFSLAHPPDSPSLLYLPFSQNLFFLSSATAVHVSSPLRLFFLPTRLSFDVNKKSKSNSWGFKVGGREAGGLTCFYTALTSSAASDKMFTEWLQHTSPDWNWVMIFPVTIIIRGSMQV